MSGRIGIGQRLYQGQVSFNFVGRRRTWYAISAIILLVSIGALLFRGLNLGIEFRGGADFAISNATCSIEQARAVAEAKTGSQAIVTSAVNGTIRVQTESLTSAESSVLAGELADLCGVQKAEIKVQVVGPTWGSEISKKALQALVVFLLLVSIFLSIYFEWRMAVAALVALAHDLVITIGIYALTGLEVTPATVIGLLTILGFSLYDTVVVFDKVRENTRNIAGQSVLTYSEAANLALNQTLVRSINTSIVALLPVLAIIVIGAGLLGAGTLLDLAVALAVGMAAGAYSSIFIATPFLAQLKERQPEIRSLTARVAARRAQASKGRTGEFGAEGVEGTGVVTTLVDGTVRQQPKRVSRSRRSKS
ncbi:MAG: protein translocase subunit SecF [Candidatus Nanopelagicales bacterium]|nr:protein translocase subunit SecF [Candidatus Nanopelagicales bacterium]